MRAAPSWRRFLIFCINLCLVWSQCELDHLEPNNNVEEATNIRLLDTLSSLTICTFKDLNDYYAFNSEGMETTLISATFFHDKSQGDIQAEVTSNNQKVSEMTPGEIEIGFVVGGVYGKNLFFLRVSRGPGVTESLSTDYSMRIQSFPCFEDPLEPNNFGPDYPFLNLGEMHEGLTLCGNERDRYRLVVLTSQMITVRVTSLGTLWAHVALYGPRGDRLIENIEARKEKQISYFHNASNDCCTFEIEVWPSQFVHGTGVYTIEISPNGGFPVTEDTLTTIPDIPTVPDTQPEAVPGSSDTNMTLGISLGIVGSILMMSCLGLGALLFWRRSRTSRESPDSHESANPSTQFFSVSVARDPEALSDWRENDIIPFKSLEFKGKIGEGSFGLVFKAKWRETTVAVKKLHDVTRGDDYTIATLRQEAQLMRNLRPNPHVLLFLGICVPPDPLCIVTEYMRNGSK